MTKNLKWSEWAFHTGGECPKEYIDAVEGDREIDSYWFGGSHDVSDRWEEATPDMPIAYRYQLPTPEPVKTKPFAIVFDFEGHPSTKWSYNEHGQDWVWLAKKWAKREGYAYVRVYDEDGNLTETSQLT